MWRTWAIFIFFITVMLAIVVRLFLIQVLNGDDWRRKADLQHFIEMTLPADRGNIEDVSHNPLVINQSAYLVYAEPKVIKDLVTFSRRISPILNLDPEALRQQLSVPNRMWLPVAKKVDSDVVDRLKSLNLTGLGYETQSIRFYPEASMAAHLLGFVGDDQNGNDKGYFGLEGYYDRDLQGKDGELLQEKDVNGNPIIVGESKRIQAQDGRTLVLWLDRAVQRMVETKLAEGITKYGAKSGTVTIMDPKTGGIIAMASWPSYDPLHYADTQDKEVYKNPVVADSYEPGSIFKVLVMAAAIEEKKVTPETMMDETGPVNIGEYSIKTWNDQYHGRISMTDVLINSSNVGMVFVAKKLGINKMLNYIHKYGFGEPTGIDLEDESSPYVRADQDWKEIDLATASFGQGIAVTPIQMVRAVAAIANGGWLLKPQMVKEIRDEHGKVIPIKPTKITQVISELTAKQVTEMMVAAVEKGEAQFAKLKGYRIAGKTGTAQIPVAGHYDTQKTIASFVGFAPADNPKFVMLVTLQEPSTSQWGSETAAPLFFSIAQDLLLYYGINPE